MKKKYLIIGGTSGIGLSTAKQLSLEGELFIVGSSERELNAVKTELGKNCHCLKYDLCDAEHIEDIFYALKENNHDHLHGMVYCAGTSPLTLLKDSTPEIVERTFRVNVFSFIECCKYFYNEEYSVEGSKIVAVASTAAHTSGYRQTAYGSSKAALVAATRLMAKELLNRNIKINCVSPGATGTKMLTQMYDNVEELNAKVLAKQQLGLIPPEAVANIVCMLLSPLSDWITGTEIIYDAGSLLC